MLRIMWVKSKWILLALFIAHPAQSREPDSPRGAPPGLPQTSLSVGLGAAHVPDYEGSDEYKLLPLLALNVENINGENTYIRFSGNLDSNIIEHPHWRFGPSAFYLSDYLNKDDSRFEKVEDDQVSRLAEAKNALQAGFNLGYDFSSDPQSQYLLEVTATHDVLRSNGSVVTPRFRTVRFLSGRLVFTGAVSASWASDRYMENRFGVTSGDALRSGLDVYNAEGGLKSFSAEMSVTRIVDRHWTATVFSRYQQMIGDAADSPIVGDRGDANSHLFGLVVSRSFLF